MPIGLFAKALPRPRLADTCTAIRALGCDTVQFNLSCVGLPTLPVQLDDAVCGEITATLRAHGITMAALSATGNIIHPDSTQRQAVHAGITTLIRASAALGTQVLTISTGTCHPHDMWQSHPDNVSPASWWALQDALAGLLPLAEAHGVTLAFEPEQGNIVRTVTQARALLDTLASPALKVVLDVANLLTPVTLAQQHAIVDDAMAQLAGDIVLVHAKEASAPPHTGECVVGLGVVDFAYLAAGLQRITYRGAIIMHGVAEAETPRGLQYLRSIFSK